MHLIPDTVHDYLVLIGSSKDLHLVSKYASPKRCNNFDTPFSSPFSTPALLCSGRNPIPGMYRQYGKPFDHPSQHHRGKEKSGSYGKQAPHLRYRLQSESGTQDAGHDEETPDQVHEPGRDSDSYCPDPVQHCQNYGHRNEQYPDQHLQYPCNHANQCHHRFPPFPPVEMISSKGRHCHLSLLSQTPPHAFQRPAAASAMSKLTSAVKYPSIVVGALNRAASRYFLIFLTFVEFEFRQSTT